MATLNTIKKHPKVDEISDERNNGDGIWIYLKPGFINEEKEVHCIHEHTIEECLEQLKNDIVECACEECFTADN